MGLELSQKQTPGEGAHWNTDLHHESSHYPTSLGPPLGPKHHGRASSRIRRKAKQGHGVVREKPGQLKGSGAEPGVQNMETRICPLLSVKLECLLQACYPPQLKDGKMSPLATEGLVRT